MSNYCLMLNTKGACRGRTGLGFLHSSFLDRPCVRAKLIQSYPTLCNPVDCSPPGYSVHVILHARILEWVAMASSGDLPNPGMEPASLMSPALADRFFTTRATWESPAWAIMYISSISIHNMYSETSENMTAC